MNCAARIGAFCSSSSRMIRPAPEKRPRVDALVLEVEFASDLRSDEDLPLGDDDDEIGARDL